MKVVFASFNSQPAYASPEPWLQKIRIFANLMEALGNKCNVIYTKQTGYEGEFLRNGVSYRFLKTKRKKIFIPLKLYRCLKKMQPDIIIVEGIRFPLQIIGLRLWLGRRVRIIGRHHADAAPGGFRIFLQSMADRCISGYLFTSIGNAADWLRKGIIKTEQKIYELVAATTDFTRQDKVQSRMHTQMKGDNNFLWIGRLNQNKDPFTVLEGFAIYLRMHPHARLYFIYQEDDLLDELKKRIFEKNFPEGAIQLVGFVAHDELPVWCSAADFFISGSHSEGGSFALLEAMACGCIPVVTTIPAALNVIENGRFGISYSPGNAKELGEKLNSISSIDRERFSKLVEEHFIATFSNNVIAEKLYAYCCSVLAE